MDEAQRALAVMAKDALPDGLHAEFTASVEDEEGEQISRASPIFRAQRGAPEAGEDENRIVRLPRERGDWSAQHG